MNLVKVNNLVFVILVFSFTSVLLGQTSGNEYRELGNPFIKYYSPKEYKANPANWCILQDKRGVMYFGNDKGILEFDGVSWRNIEVPFSASVRSMAIDDSGKIYVCASSDFGYLEPDSLGQLKFKSLLGYLDQKDRNYGEMWDVITSSKAVYFKTKDKIFRWNGKKIKVWDSVYAFRLYNIDDKIYSRNQGTGLMVIEGESIKLMPDGEYFDDTGVFNMLPFGKDSLTGEERILVTTNDQGLFLSKGYKFYPFKTEDDSFLKTSQVYNACSTSDGNFAFATQRGGVIIMDHKGDFQNIINDNSGMPTKVIYDVYSDKQGGLWFATNNGIVHCEIPSSLMVLPQKYPAKYPFFSMLQYKNKFYATDELGIIYLGKYSSAFNLVKGINKPGYGLLNFQGILLAAVNDGVSIIKNDKLQERLTNNSTNRIIPSVYYPDRLYSFHGDGLSVLKFDKSKNEFHVYQTDIDEELVNGVEGPDSSLWIGSFDGGIFHVTDNLDNLVAGQINKIKYTRYRKETLPAYETALYNIQNKILLATNKGLYRFDKTAEKFVVDSTLGSEFADSTSNILYIAKGKSNELWILANVNGTSDLGKAELQNNEKYNWKPDPVFRRLDLNSISAMYAEIDSVTYHETLWLSTDEGLVHYNDTRTKEIKNIFPALIRTIVVNSDSIIYYGANQSAFQNNRLILPFSSKNVGFTVSSISFDKPDANMYQYFLEGNDDKWSKWTNESKKEYTNLSSGDYTFKIRAKNVYGMISQEASFSFKVLSPWYLTWWAYTIYLLGFVGMLGGIRKFELNRRQEKEDRRILELENKRKTDELEQARSLQLSMLPKEVPSLSGIDISVYMKTATEVGGDYYDFYLADSGELTTIIGDATGHGLNAGMLVSVTKGMFQNLASQSELEKIISQFNTALISMELQPMYMSLSLIRITNNRLQVVGAGMPPFLYYQAKSKIITEIESSGPPLGGLPGFIYQICNYELSKGDVIVMMSDGFAERRNANKEVYGWEKGKELLTNISHLGSEQIIEELVKAGDEWGGDRQQDDDITFVVIKVK